MILSAKKVLNGRTLKANEFTFVLKDADGKELQSKTNAADGTVSFDEISYELKDVENSPIVYTIEEVKGSDKSVSYDSHVETITVTLTDDGKGKITATPDKTSADVLFENGTYSVHVQKTDVATGKELEGATIQIIDSEGNVVESWTSTKEAHEVKGLKTGETYTLKETVAPDGYTITSETTFTIGRRRQGNLLGKHHQGRGRQHGPSGGRQHHRCPRQQGRCRHG